MRLILLATIFLLSSCASHNHVRPGENGIHRVVIRGDEKDKVEIMAIREANHFCKEMNKVAYFVNEETKYTGSMDESTHKTIKRASKAAKVGGAVVGAMGGEKESNIGKGVFGAGVIGSAVLDNDVYTADMKFKCE